MSSIFPVTQVTVSYEITTPDSVTQWVRLLETETILPVQMTDREGSADMVRAASDRMLDTLTGKARQQIDFFEVWVDRIPD